MSSISEPPTRNVLRSQPGYPNQSKSSSDAADMSTDSTPVPVTKNDFPGGDLVGTQGVSQMQILSGGQVRKTEWKLVYRTLRLISDWTLSGFFSEVCVVGTENVPKEGALILLSRLRFSIESVRANAFLIMMLYNSTPCHHNEIIDIATLCEFD